MLKRTSSGVSLNQSLLNRLRSGHHIPALDAVRGLSACVVVIAHIIGPVQVGGMAVAVFFVLSGFLITWLLLLETAASGTVSLRGFYTRRTLRIFPAFYVFWVISISAAYVRRIPVQWPEALASFFYMGDYYSALHASHVHQIMGVTWSLGIEEKFYLLWPVVFLTFCKDPARLLKFTTIAIVVLWAYRVIAFFTLPLPGDYLRYSFDSRFDNILYGCALALALFLVKLEPLLALADRVKILPFAIGLGLLVGGYFEGYWGNEIYYIVVLPVASLLIAIMLVQLVFLASLRGSSWLENPVLRFLGLISYSLYLYHLIVIVMVERFLPHLQLRMAFPLMFGLSLLVAYLSYKLVEQPFLGLKNHFLPAAAAAVTASVR